MAFIRCILIVFTLLNCTLSASVEQSFIDIEIVPDILNVAPTKEIKISYPSGVSVNFGNELTPTQVRDKPTVEYEADKNKLYTLIMTDPDAPSRAAPQMREFFHWGVINIKGSDVSSGKEIVGFVGSGPPKATGLHRYTFVAYEQNGSIDYQEPIVSNMSTENRPSFSVQKFAEKYNLGNPIAGNFYQAQYDDYVPTVHAQLGLKMK